MAYIDLYCERLGPGLFAEPLNAVSNAAFLVAAWMVWRDSRGLASRVPEVPLLAGLIAAIGIGSGLFHTFAESWARVLDVVPILLFQLVFLWAYSHRVLRWNPIAAVSLVIVFLAVVLYARQFPRVLNGSLTYAPAILALLVLGTVHWMRGEAGRPLLLAAAGVFSVSLTLRTVDQAACPYVPIGTHFLWHLLNAVLLYLCSRSLYAAGRARAMESRAGRLA